MIGLFLSACRASGNLLGSKNSDIKLYSGIIDNNLELISEALEDGATINKIEGRGSLEPNPIWITTDKYTLNYRISEYLINQGADVNYPNKDGETLLSFYAYNTNVHFCELLINHGAKIDTEENGYTALEYALDHYGGEVATEKNVDRIITMLLEHGAKIRPKTLEVALKAGHGDFTYMYRINKRILEGLIKEGYKSGLDPALEATILGESSKLDTLIKDNKMKKEDEQKILFYTAAYGNVETMKLLEDKGLQLESSNQYKYTPLIIASYYGNLDMVKYLISKGVTLEVRTTDAGSSKSALNFSVENNQYDVVEYLIQKGADIKPFLLFAGSVDVLSEAAENGNIKIIKLILNNGYLINTNNKWGAIEQALRNKHMDVAKFLFDIGTDIVKENDSIPDFYYLTNLEVIKFLVEHGYKVDGKYDDGGLLRYASEAGNTETVEYLIKKGANVNAVNIAQDGEKVGLKYESALMMATRRGNFDIVKLLVENGADLEQQFEFANKDTVILTAAVYGSRNIMEYLIKKGVYVNFQNQLGETALLCAARKGWIDLVEMLIENGADKNLKDKDGHTALYFAKKYKHKDIIEFLK